MMRIQDMIVSHSSTSDHTLDWMLYFVFGMVLTIILLSPWFILCHTWLRKVCVVALIVTGGVFMIPISHAQLSYMHRKYVDRVAHIPIEPYTVVMSASHLGGVVRVSIIEKERMIDGIQVRERVIETFPTTWDLAVAYHKEHHISVSLPVQVQP